MRLFQADAKHDAEFVRNGLRLGHHRRRSARVAGNWQISASVDRVSALMG